MASQKRTVFFPLFVLVAFVEETKFAMASEDDPISKTICESFSDAISCQEGKIIHVMQASYGRQDLSTCPHKDETDTNCHAGNSHAIMEDTCDYRQFCELYADNSVFGDPCPGTSKYLFLKYQCADLINICEGNKGTITCQGGKHIHLLETSYGRHDHYTCPGQSTTNTNCHAGSSHGIVAAACDKKPSCELHAVSSVFGEPCSDTNKYLRVKYQCI